MFRATQLQSFLAKPDQEKVMANSSLNEVSNHFMWKSQHIHVRYADWHFVFKARMSTIIIIIIVIVIVIINNKGDVIFLAQLLL